MNLYREKIGNEIANLGRSGVSGGAAHSCGLASLGESLPTLGLQVGPNTTLSLALFGSDLGWGVYGQKSIGLYDRSLDYPKAAFFCNS